MGALDRDEDKLERAAALLAEFRQDPARPQYRAQAKAAAGLRAQQAKNEAAYQKRVRNRRALFQPLTGYGFGVVTYALIGISVVVCILSNFGHDPQLISGLFITSPMVDQGQMAYTPGLPEVRHGQVWRLLTAHLHSFRAAAHPVQHALAARFGKHDRGAPKPLASGTPGAGLGRSSRTWHSTYMHGPMFGGMSGVVYGLLGYIWIRGKLDPGSGLYLHPTTVWMMIVWFALCFTPLLGAIANTVHAVGLGLGMAWGFLSSLRHR